MPESEPTWPVAYSHATSDDDYQETGERFNWRTTLAYASAACAIIAFIAVCALWLRQGSGAPPPPAPATAASQSPTPTGADAPWSGDNAADRQYFAYFAQHHTPIYDYEAAKTDGLYVCNRLDAGAELAEITPRLTAKGMSVHQANLIVAAATDSYCPHHRSVGAAIDGAP